MLSSPFQCEESMAVGRVLRGGEVSLPAEVQAAVGIEPGDLVSIDVTSRGTVEIRRMPRLTLAEALDRYRIDGPIDEATDRESWQDVAAQDVFGADHRG
jgi:bifunctional DNA-binding transcriptional regulator/antitoxin component of YhaV-PrlF toxin-antitoxin module